MSDKVESRLINPAAKRQWCRTPATGRYSAYMITIGSLCMLLMAFAPAGFGEEFHNALSLQGFTGLLNTPNAEVTDEGKVYTLFSNQKESQWRDSVAHQENYLFSFGLFSFAEVGGRLSQAPNNVNDLSASFKVKVPFIPKRYYLPDIAFGMQDVGGGAKLLQTKYAVATKDWWRLRFSLGYGTGPDRMDGVFGGFEFKTFDWLYLLGEYDTKETNVGLRLVSPRLFGLPVNLQATAKTSLNYRPGNMEFGIGLQIPLGFEYRKKKPLPVEEDAEQSPARAADPTKDGMPKDATTPTGADAVDSGEDGLQLLRQKLTADGFQNVRIGAANGRELLVIEYENGRYNHNELDALGVVAGSAVDTVSPAFREMRLIMKKKGIRVLQLSALLSEWKEFLYDPDKYWRLAASLKITPEATDDKTVQFIEGDSNPSWLTSELVLYPGLKTFVGTEVGLFDYLLSVKPDYYLNIWKGAVLNARFDIPVSWSRNFDDGQVFQNSRAGSQADQLMIFQTLKLTPRVMLNLGAGMILHDAYGTVNELLWTPGNGNHRFGLKQAYASSSDPQSPYQGNRVYLGSYRYYHAPLDLYLEGTAGQFLDNDRGFSVELKRFFGDTALSFFYKNSWTEANQTTRQEHVQMAGLQISIPLTPRRDMKPYLVQVKGSNEWTYTQETKVVTPGSANDVTTSIGRNPVPAYNLERVYYNRDRLSEEYIRMNLGSLRNAYMTYVNRGAALKSSENPPHPDVIVIAAESFFIALKNKNYTAIWEVLSRNSRRAVLHDAAEEYQKQGLTVEKEKLAADFRDGGTAAGDYWHSVSAVFDPDIALEQCRWKMGKMGENEAEIVLHCGDSVNQMVLKLYRESGKWKFGWEESFGARRRPALKG
jgi:hypothetical protein